MNSVPFDFMDRVIANIPRLEGRRLHQIEGLKGPWSRAYKRTWECIIELNPTSYLVRCFMEHLTTGGYCKCCREPFDFPRWNPRNCAIARIEIGDERGRSILDAPAREKLKWMLRANKRVVDVNEVFNFYNQEPNYEQMPVLLKEIRGFGCVNLLRVGLIPDVLHSILQKPISLLKVDKLSASESFEALADAVSTGPVKEFIAKHVLRSHINYEIRLEHYVELVQRVLEAHAVTPPQMLTVWRGKGAPTALVDEYEKAHNVKIRNGDYSNQVVHYKR